MTTNLYIEHGYNGRKDYVNTLADDLGVERPIAYALANMLGPSEDFDGLVTALEDYASME